MRRSVSSIDVMFYISFTMLYILYISPPLL